MNIPHTCLLSLKPPTCAVSCVAECTTRLQNSEHVLLRLLRLYACSQESEIDADSIRSRFRFLIPIMLGACHVMACVLWYVGTYKLPSVGQADADAAGTDPTSMDNAQNYQNQRNTTWLGGYSGKLIRDSQLSRHHSPLTSSKSDCSLCNILCDLNYGWA